MPISCSLEDVAKRILRQRSIEAKQIVKGVRELKGEPSYHLIGLCKTFLARCNISYSPENAKKLIRIIRNKISYLI